VGEIIVRRTAGEGRAAFDQTFEAVAEDLHAASKLGPSATFIRMEREKHVGIHSDIYVNVPHFADKFGVERMLE
jgi:hypothetical protein